MARTPSSVSPPVSLAASARWLVPFLAIAAVAMVVVPLQLAFPTTWFLTVFVLPIAVVSYMAGRASGLLTLGLAAFAGAYLTLPPALSLALAPEAYPALAVFITVGLTAVWSGHHVRRLQQDRFSFHQAERRRSLAREALAELGGLSLERVPTEQLMQRAAEIAANTLGVDFAVVLELQPDWSRFVAQAAVGWRDRCVDAAIAGAPGDRSTQAGHALAVNGPVVVDDLRADPRFRGASPPIGQVVSGVTVVIPGSSRPVGVLGAHASHRRTFTAYEVAFLQDVATSLGAAILRRASDEAILASEERLRLALEAGQLGTWEWHMATGQVAWSARMQEIHGLRPGAFGGTYADARSFLHPDDAAMVQEALQRASAERGRFQAEYRIMTPDGEVRWLAARGIVISDEAGNPTRWVGVASDLTQRRAAEDERQRLLALERQSRQEAEIVAARHAFLASASLALASTLDFDQTLSNVASVAVPGFADWCTFDLRREDGTLQRVAIHHRDPAKVDLARELLREHPVNPDLPRGPYAVVRTGQAQLFPEVTDSLLRDAAHSDVHFELLRRLELQSVMIVPLVARGRTVGALTLAWAESRKRYTEDDLKIAVELGRRAGLFVDNARMYERERRIAATLQEAFLPASLPNVPGFSLDVAFVADSNEAKLGGDWYDVFQLADGRLAISLGDVMGHGLRAAGAMGLVRQTIRAAAHDRDSAGAILSQANRLLRTTAADDKATAVVAILDPLAATLTYACAGHPTPMVAMPDGRVLSGAPGGPPLGLARPGERYQEHTMMLPPGALAVLYTDGLTEYARDPVMGEDKLRDALHRECRQVSPHPADSIRRRVMGDLDPHDDVAILTVAVAARPLAHLDLTLPALPESLPLLRRAVAHFLLAWGVESDRVATLQIALGEAANNVVEHAYGAARGTLAVSARWVGADLVVEVNDHGAWRRSRSDSGGRGLRIMRGLVDSVEIESEAAGTTVRLVLLGARPLSARGEEVWRP